MTGRPPTWLLALAVPVIALIAVLVTRAVEGPSESTVARAGANAVVIKSFAFHPPKLTGLVIAELLVLSLRFDRLATPAAVFGVLFALGAIGAYALARTSGLLGFSESGWSTEAVISKAAELIAVVSLGAYLLTSVRSAPRRATPDALEVTE